MFDLQRMEQSLQDILDEHEILTTKAEQFGLRLAAKGLMPLAEAQRVVADFDANTAKLRAYIHALPDGRGLPKDILDDIDKVYEKASKYLKKFDADLKAAQDALAKYEDMLVGEHFQEAFEAVRHAILDLDLADDVDVDFKTTLFLNDDPAYGVGSIFLLRKTQEIYRVVVTYRASDDTYWGNIVSGKRGTTFKDVVRKVGHAYLPKFVRELVGQVKALDDADGTNIFRSRKKVELTISDPAQTSVALEAALKKHFADTMPPKATATLSRHVYTDSSNQTTAGFLIDLGQWNGVVFGISELERHFQLWSKTSGALAAPFKIQIGKNTWTVQSYIDHHSIGYYDKKSWKYAKHVQDVFDYINAYYPEWGNKKMSLQQWKTIGISRGINVSQANRGSQVENALRMQLQGIHGISYKFSLALTLTPVKKTASSRVATAFLSRTAGATPFINYIKNPQVERAFEEAKREEGHRHGHGYSGTIAEKSSYQIRHRTPMSPNKAREYAEDDMDNNDKWDSHAFAVPVSGEKVLGSDKVVVSVEAKNVADAVRQGTLRIKATGRIPPRVTVTVSDVTAKVKADGARVSTYDVTGTRKQVLVTEVEGWLFYGWAAS